jgi:hypothetical protein
VRTIDLRDTENEEVLLEDEEQSRNEIEGDTGVTDTEAFEGNDEGMADVLKEVQETVRFQFDGQLRMNVNVPEMDPDVAEGPTVVVDELTCDNFTMSPNPDTYSTQSFHVIDYMKLFDVRIDLKYEIFDGMFCDDIDEESHKIQIESNVGMDQVAGFEAFFAKLGEGDQILLSDCYVDPCVEAITSDENGAGLVKKLVTGRPNVNAPYTKNIKFTAMVHGSLAEVKHVAEVFVEGLFSSGQGNSFALPKYEPLMVLRDPPGM